MKIEPSEYAVIANLYTSERKSAEQIAKLYDVSNWTILSILRKLGVEIRSAAGYHTSADNANRKAVILQMYGDGCSLSEIQKVLNIRRPALNEHLTKLGLPLAGKSHKHHKPEDMPLLSRKAINLYKVGLTIRQISTRLEIHDSTVSKFLREAGVPLRTGRQVVINRAKIFAQERLGLYESGMSFSQIDAYLGDPRGAARISLKRYYPDRIKPEKQRKDTLQRKTRKRI